MRLADDIGGKARGAYDILVRPATKDATAMTQGLVEPNFLGFSGAGGITLAQLARVRALDGVEVAAPISIVGQVTGGWQTPTVSLPPSDVSRVYRFTVTQRVSDGVTDRVVSTQSFSSLLAGAAGGESTSTGVGSFVAGDAESGWFLAGFPLPPVAASVVAVDPVAEAALVGHPVGALTALAALRDRASGTFTGQTIHEAVAAAIQDEQLVPNASLGSAVVPRGVGWVVPVVAADSDPSTGALDITAEVLVQGAVVDAALAGGDARSVLAQWRDTDQPVSVEQARIPADLRPLGVGNLTFKLAGATQDAPASGLLAQADGLLVDRPEYRIAASEDGGLHVQIVPTGLVPMTGPEVELRAAPGSGVGEVAVAGSEQSYRDTAAVTLANDVVYFPIEGFAAAELVPSSQDEGRVSLGAYDVPPLTVARSTIAVPGTTLLPTLNTAGLVVRPPAAIADLRDAELLRGEAPIDAIRVRVSDISAVDELAARRVENVATLIAGLGLEVDIVIGSSPQEVSIEVDDYVVGPGDATADLGTVTQRWTTMGAATTVSRGLTRTTGSLAVLAALTALVATFTAHLIEASSARRDAAILRVTGWSRSAIRRRFLTAPLVAAVIGLGLIAAVWLTGARDPMVGVIGLTLGLLSPCATLVSTLTLGVADPLGGSRAGEASGHTPRRPVRSPWSLGRRLALSTPARTGALVALLSVSAAAGGLGVVTYLGRGAAAGPTLLGTTLTSTLAGAHLVMMLVLFGTGLGFGIWLWRYMLARGRATNRSLSAVGWSRAELRRLWLSLLCWVSLPSALVAAGLASLLSAGSDVPQPALAAGVGLATGLALGIGMAVSIGIERKHW